MRFVCCLRFGCHILVKLRFRPYVFCSISLFCCRLFQCISVFSSFSFFPNLWCSLLGHFHTLVAQFRYNICPFPHLPPSLCRPRLLEIILSPANRYTFLVACILSPHFAYAPLFAIFSSLTICCQLVHFCGCFIARCSASSLFLSSYSSFISSWITTSYHILVSPCSSPHLCHSLIFTKKFVSITLMHYLGALHYIPKCLPYIFSPHMFVSHKFLSCLRGSHCIILSFTLRIHREMPLIAFSVSLFCLVLEVSL